MKRLFLVRHAKSSWVNHTIPDIDRPLNERGYRDAHAMSEYLVKNKLSPQIVLTSPAIRAVSTALIFSRAFSYDEGAIILSPSLYESSAEEYLRVIREQDDQFGDMFLFAHNPTISEFFNIITRGESEEMPTCTVAIAEFEVDSWRKADYGLAKRGDVFKPALISAL